MKDLRPSFECVGLNIYCNYAMKVANGYCWQIETHKLVETRNLSVYTKWLAFFRLGLKDVN